MLKLLAQKIQIYFFLFPSEQCVKAAPPPLWHFSANVCRTSPGCGFSGQTQITLNVSKVHLHLLVKWFLVTLHSGGTGRRVNKQVYGDQCWSDGRKHQSGCCVVCLVLMSYFCLFDISIWMKNGYFRFKAQRAHGSICGTKWTRLCNQEQSRTFVHT